MATFSASILVAPSFATISTKTATVLSGSSGGSGPTAKTEGQIWPRGNW